MEGERKGGIVGRVRMDDRKTERTVGAVKMDDRKTETERPRE